MDLILEPPINPLAPIRRESLPGGDEWCFQPKWNGFRCIAFKDRGEVTLQSRNRTRSSSYTLNRFFPEVVDAFASLKGPRRCVLDGELMIFRENEGSFSDLLRRLSAGRHLRHYSMQTPATFVAFDLLVNNDNQPIYKEPFRARRDELIDLGAEHLKNNRHIMVTFDTTESSDAEQWLKTRGTLDGVVCRNLDKPYVFGSTRSAFKVKPLLEIDCVVGGVSFSAQNIITTLHLGLYDPKHLLNYVGSVTLPKELQNKEATEMFERIKGGKGFTGIGRAGRTRFHTNFAPVEPLIVVTTALRHFSGGRIKGFARIVGIGGRDAALCTFAQLESDHVEGHDQV